MSAKCEALTHEKWTVLLLGNVGSALLWEHE